MKYVVGGLTALTLTSAPRAEAFETASFTDEFNHDGTMVYLGCENQEDQIVCRLSVPEGEYSSLRDGGYGRPELVTVRDFNKDGNADLIEISFHRMEEVHDITLFRGRRGFVQELRTWKARGNGERAREMRESTPFIGPDTFGYVIRGNFYPSERELVDRITRDGTELLDAAWDDITERVYTTPETAGYGVLTQAGNSPLRLIRSERRVYSRQSSQR